MAMSQAQATEISNSSSSDWMEYLDYDTLKEYDNNNEDYFSSSKEELSPEEIEHLFLNYSQEESSLSYACMETAEAVVEENSDGGNDDMWEYIDDEDDDDNVYHLEVNHSFNSIDNGFFIGTGIILGYLLGVLTVVVVQVSSF